MRPLSLALSLSILLLSPGLEPYRVCAQVSAARGAVRALPVATPGLPGFSLPTIPGLELGNLNLDLQPNLDPMPEAWDLGSARGARGLDPRIELRLGEAGLRQDAISPAPERGLSPDLRRLSAPIRRAARAERPSRDGAWSSFLGWSGPIAPSSAVDATPAGPALDAPLRLAASRMRSNEPPRPQGVGRSAAKVGIVAAALAVVGVLGAAAVGGGALGWWNLFGLDLNPLLPYAKIVGVLTGTWASTKVASGVTARVLKDSKLEPRTKAAVQTGVTTLFWAGGLATSLYVLGMGLGDLVEAIGFLGFAASLTLHTYLGNFAGGLKVKLSRFFTKGDRVKVGSLEGEVEETGFQSTVLRSGGERHVVRNGTLLDSVLTLRGAARNEAFIAALARGPEAAKTKLWPVLAAALVLAATVAVPFAGSFFAFDVNPFLTMIQLAQTGAATYLLAKALYAATGWILKLFSMAERGRFGVQRVVSSLVWLAGSVLFMHYLGIALGSSLQSIGFLSLGLSLVLSTFLSSLAGGFDILLGDTFRAGDRIRVRGVEGEVLAINYQETTLRDGDDIHVVPNNAFHGGSFTLIDKSAPALAALPLAGLLPAGLDAALPAWAVTAGVVGAILAGTWLAARLAARLAKALLGRVDWDPMREAWLARGVKTLVWAAGLGWALTAAGFSPASVLAGAGVYTLAVSFAVKDIVASVGAGFILFFNRSFEVGDAVKVGKAKAEDEGVVAAINTRYVTLDTSANADAAWNTVLIPNQLLLNEKVYNKSASRLAPAALALPALGAAAPWLLFAGKAAALVGGTWLAGKLAGALSRRAFARLQDGPRRFAENAVHAAVWAAGLMGLLSLFGVSLTGLVASLGLLGALIPFLMKDLANNLVAGLMVAVYRPFKLGETVKIADEEGRVVDITHRYVTLELAATDADAAGGYKTVSIPNENLLKERVYLGKK